MQSSFAICLKIIVSILILYPNIPWKPLCENVAVGQVWISYWKMAFKKPGTRNDLATHGKTYQSFSGTAKLFHFIVTDFPSRSQLCTAAVNCPSRCTELETSYSIQLPAHKSIVTLASNVTCLRSECKADHRARETCLYEDKELNPDCCHCHWKSQWCDWLSNCLVVLYPAGFVWSTFKSPWGATPSQVFLPFLWFISWFVRHITGA